MLFIQNQNILQNYTSLLIVSAKKNRYKFQSVFIVRYFIQNRLKSKNVIRLFHWPYEILRSLMIIFKMILNIRTDCGRL